MSLLRGRRYNRVKRQGQRTDLTSRQSGEKSTATLESQYGVNARTLTRDGAFASAVESLKPIIPDVPSD